MFNSFQFASLLKSRTVSGLEIVFLPEGDMEFNQVVLKKNKSGLEIGAVYTGLKEMEAVQKKLDTKLPVNVVINGKGIIHKKISLQEGDTDAKLLEKVFPNARLNDFYLQRTEISDNSVFVSIARKNTIDGLLASFTDAGYYFSGISFGPFCLNAIFPFIGVFEGESGLAGYRLSVNNESRIIDFWDDSVNLAFEKISIAGEEIRQQAAIAFAAAFKYFVQELKTPSLSVAVVEMNRAELEQKKLFQISGLGILFFFLAVLMVNFFLFDYYGKQYHYLESMFLGSKEQLAKINEMKIKIKEKQLFFDKTGLKGTSKTSYYADRIAAGMPVAIRLTELHVYPAEKKAKKEEPVIFLKKTILIKGNCEKSTELNKWIRSIKENTWVSEVSVLNYKQEDAKDPGEFEIKVIIS